MEISTDLGLIQRNQPGGTAPLLFGKLGVVVPQDSLAYLALVPRTQ